MKANSVSEFLDAYDMGEARFVEAPTEVWLEIIATRPGLRETVADNRTIPDEVILELAKDDNWRVRWRIGIKRKTPADVLLALASDSDASIRHTVACHRKVTREVLVALIDDEWEKVREVARERLKEMEEFDDNAE